MNVQEAKKLSVYNHSAEYPCSAVQLHSWHSRPGALERLLPPWEKTRIKGQTGGIDPGGKVQLRMYQGPFSLAYHALHIENIPGQMFRDIQERGPFKSFSHSHLFQDTANGSMLNDRIEYSLPLHQLLPSPVKKQVHEKLQRMFEYRTRILQGDIALHNQYSQTPLRILITGASGVLGNELLPFLRTGGHQIWTLVRRKPDHDKGEIFWDPEKEILEADSIPEIDAVIHMAGEYIGLGRWSDEKKQRVISSRVKGTRLLCRTLASLPNPPKVLLSASAVGYYGHRDAIELDEQEKSGNDFISSVCRLWESGAEDGQKAGIRTVFLRLGVGLTPRGGALQRILQNSPIGFVRRFGAGTQYISWISTDDIISAILHCMVCNGLEGPVNLAAPVPVTNSEFMATMARVTGRPLLCPIPAGLLRALYGQMANEVLLSGCHVSSRKLIDSGFEFRHQTLEQALRHLLGKALRLQHQEVVRK